MMDSLKQSFGLKPSTPRPKVSVIIPCYNQGGFLSECLASLEAQTYQNFEVLIVNDGSTEDATLTILQTLESQGLNILNQSNQGLPAARNQGISKARGDWIIPLDADDKLAPSYISKTLALAKEQSLDFVVTDIQNFGAQARIHRTNINLYDQLYDNRLTCCALLARHVFDQLKYDESFTRGLEDWELWIRILKANLKGEVIHEPLFHYRRKSKSMLTQSQISRSQIIKHIRQKHGDLYAPEQQAILKKIWKENQVVFHKLHELHYHIGLRFPRMAKMLGNLYVKIRGHF